ncbi:MAG: HNH endonuclease [Gammaproteobacteria bacterium]|nr:HNH endonuclease [Gammaproteobacteria bacterium]
MLVDGVKKHVKGHRIVLNAYAGVRNDLCVNHKNGVKSDNRLVNLEWVTVAENNAHAIRTGLLDPRKADHSWRNKVFKEDYVTIYALHKCFGVPRIVLAQRNRVSRQTIDKVVATVHRHVGRFYGAA